MTQQKQTRTPLIEPILLVMKSRRFIVAVTALIVSALIGVMPELESLRSELTMLIGALALALIGGYSLEDSAIALRENPPTDDPREQIHDVIDAVLEQEKT